MAEQKNIRKLWELTDEEMLEYKLKPLPQIRPKLEAFAREYVSNGFKAGPAYLKHVAVNKETPFPEQSASALLHQDKKLCDYIMGLWARQMFQPGLVAVRKELLSMILDGARHSVKESARAKYAELLTRVLFPSISNAVQLDGNTDSTLPAIQIVLNTDKTTDADSK